jgi:hypothetical protein
VWRCVKHAPAACEPPSITGRASLPSTTPAVAAATQHSERVATLTAAPSEPLPIARNPLDHWWGVPPLIKTSRPCGKRSLTLYQTVEGPIAGQAEDIIDGVALTPRHDFGAAVMTVGPNSQSYCGPVVANATTKQRRGFRISKPDGILPGHSSTATDAGCRPHCG